MNDPEQQPDWDSQDAAKRQALPQAEAEAIPAYTWQKPEIEAMQVAVMQMEEGLAPTFAGVVTACDETADAIRAMFEPALEALGPAVAAYEAYKRQRERMTPVRRKQLRAYTKRRAASP